MKSPPGLFILTILLCLAVSIGLQAADTPDLQRVLASLSDAAVSSENLHITAQETSVIFTAHNPATRLLGKDSTLTKQQIDNLVSTTSGAQVITNVCSRIYQFRKDLVLVTMVGTNQQTKQVEERTLATEGHVFVSRSFIGVGDSTNLTTLGEVYPRVGKHPVGWPYFLSLRSLVDWLASGRNMSCSAGTSSEGEECYVISFSPQPDSPVAQYKLFVSRSKLIPVGFDSYLPDGKVFSSTTLAFGAQPHSSFCSRAETKVFSGGHVFKHTVWSLVSIQPDDSPIIDNTDAFFAPGTLVLDKRASKPITYTQGTRPPNAQETRAMLENPRAVAKYETATHTAAALERLKAARLRLASDPKRPWIRALLFASLLLPPMIVSFLIFRKRHRLPCEGATGAGR